MEAVAILTAVNALNEGKQAKRAKDYNADVMESEAAIAMQQGGAREDQNRRRAREFMGTQRASAAQAGVGLGGSIGDVLGDSAAEAELDSLNIRYESNLQSLGMKNQAAMTRWEGKELKRQAKVKAVTSLITGGANYAKSSGFDFGSKGPAGGSTGGSGVTSGSSGQGFKSSGGQGFRVK